MAMPEIGHAVTFVDQKGRRRAALVTQVWPGMGGEDGAGVNVVLVNDDAAQEDSYGRKLVRETSVPPKSSQPAPGFYWE